VTGTQAQLFVNGELVYSDSLERINSITIDGSDDDDFITVEGDFNRAQFPVTLRGGAGNDQFFLGGTQSSLGGLPNGLSVDGGPGADRLVLSDVAASPSSEDWRAPPSYTIDGNTVTRSYVDRAARPDLHVLQVGYQGLEELQVVGGNHGHQFS